MNQQANNRTGVILATVAVATANMFLGPLLVQQANPFAVLLHFVRYPSYLVHWLGGGFGAYFIFAGLTAIVTLRTQVQRSEREQWIKFMFWSTLFHLSVLGLSSYNRSDVSTNSTSQVQVQVKAQEQTVGAFTVSYYDTFSKNEVESSSFRSAIDSAAPGSIETLTVYTSRPACGIGEARLVVFGLMPHIDPNLDGAAQESINHVSALEGIHRPDASFTELTVSGLPARRVSFQATRWKGMVGMESLIVVDPEAKLMWQLQLIFYSRGHDFSLLSPARACAVNILESVEIAGVP